MSDIPSDSSVDQGRRTWVAIAAGTGALGGVAVVVPFVSTFAPSERAKAAGAAVEADISSLKPGEKKAAVAKSVPIGRFATPDDIKGLAVFLASADSDYILAQTYNVDGGNWMS